MSCAVHRCNTEVGKERETERETERERIWKGWGTKSGPHGKEEGKGIGAERSETLRVSVVQCPGSQGEHTRIRKEGRGRTGCTAGMYCMCGPPTQMYHLAREMKWVDTMRKGGLGEARTKGS